MQIFCYHVFTFSVPTNTTSGKADVVEIVLFKLSSFSLPTFLSESNKIRQFQYYILSRIVIQFDHYNQLKCLF